MVILVLGWFFGTWIGVAYLLRKKKTSWVMTVCGSLLAAFLLLAVPRFFIGDLNSTPDLKNCQAGLDYYKSAGINVVKKDQPSDTPADMRLDYSGQISVSGPGIISCGHALYMCNKGNVTLWFGGDCKIDRNQGSEALKTIAPIVLIKTNTAFTSSEAQRRLLFEIGSKLQPDNDWHVQDEPGYKFRVMNVQADEEKNYFLTIQSQSKDDK